MSRLGSRKEFTKFHPKEGMENCIDAHLVSEVTIPKGIKILGTNIMLKQFGKSHKLIVPNALKKLGVSTMRETVPIREISMNFDEVSQSKIIKNVKIVCLKMGLDWRKAHHRSLTLADENNTTSCLFRRTMKENHPDETDLRKKLVVLAAKEGKGKVHDLFTKLGVAKFICAFETIQVKVAKCRRA